MLQNKSSFLKGLGWGFIAGAVLLQIMITAREAGGGDSRASRKAPELTAELIKDKADSLNLKVYDKDTKVYEQNELNEAVNKAVEKAKADAAAAAAPVPAPTPEASKQISVYIMDGMTAVAVTDLLNKSGIIADRAAFEQAMNQGQLRYQIRAGMYTFGLNENIDDVIAKLTTPPRF